MKTALTLPRLFAIFSLLAGHSSLAQPWSVPISNANPHVPPPPNWNHTVSPATPVAPSVPVVRPPQPATPPQMANMPLPAGVLAFDAEQKDYVAKAGEANGSFVFNVTNISPSEVKITYIQTSCGCTTAKIQLPLILAPGSASEIPINMSLLGKSGVVVKSVTIHSDKGLKVLMVKSDIQPPAADPAAVAMNRERNQQIALRDRQSVFKGECATCHVQPVIGKMGPALFTSACGICHEAKHRATMVTDLHNLKAPPTAEFWKLSIANGKPGTLMPAFAQAQGGPLSDAQIASLVDYLVKDFPATKASTPTHASAN